MRARVRTRAPGPARKHPVARRSTWTPPYPRTGSRAKWRAPRDRPPRASGLPHLPPPRAHKSNISDWDNNCINIHQNITNHLWLSEWDIGNNLFISILCSSTSGWSYEVHEGWEEGCSEHSFGSGSIYVDVLGCYKGKIIYNLTNIILFTVINNCLIISKLQCHHQRQSNNCNHSRDTTNNGGATSP